MPANDLPDAVYFFDQNHRIYPKDGNGRPVGAPIYREHWRKFTVIGEQGRSWLVSEYPHKLSKAKVKFASAVDDDCWLRSKRYRLSRKIEQCSDVALLRSIAALVGLEDEDIDG